MTAPAGQGAPAHGQRTYEQAAAEAEPWHGPLPAWDELAPGQRSGWSWAESLLPIDQRPHCFCEHGPCVIEWSGRHHAWIHTDGWPCPDSANRPAPDSAELALFGSAR